MKVRAHAKLRFLTALTHFEKRERSPGQLRSRRSICEFYVRRIDEAATSLELELLSLDKFWVWNTQDYRRRPRLDAYKGGLRKAFHEVASMVNDHIIRLRTNGQLILGGGGLDARLAPGAGSRSTVSLEGTFDGSVVRIDSSARIKRGALVRVEVMPADIAGDPTAPRPIAPGGLGRLVGAARLGGDSVVDAETLWRP